MKSGNQFRQNILFCFFFFLISMSCFFENSNMKWAGWALFITSTQQTKKKPSETLITHVHERSVWHCQLLSLSVSAPAYPLPSHILSTNITNRESELLLLVLSCFPSNCFWFVLSFLCFFDFLFVLNRMHKFRWILYSIRFWLGSVELIALNKHIWAWNSFVACEWTK